MVWFPDKVTPRDARRLRASQRNTTRCSNVAPVTGFTFVVLCCTTFTTTIREPLLVLLLPHENGAQPAARAVVVGSFQNIFSKLICFEHVVSDV